MRGADCRRLLKRWMNDGSFDELLPEVAALRGVPQPEAYHAEGDVFTHTMLAVDALDDDVDPRVFWGTLLHDIGKAQTTVMVNGQWHAYGHAKAGALLVPAAMERIGFPHLAPDVAWLVREHLFHFTWELRGDGTLTKLQRRYMEQPLFPLLLQVCLADAVASYGKSLKGRKIEEIAEMYEEFIPGEEWPLD
ncbi:HD domain-containing protein [Geomonas sp. RF6]|uniref:HD domain-containing protein n=1 Tax=Geomonas sp. RF6 TaxID=2897342 RepID=UPI001E53CE7F|nr:HD domain-containing protein [Geomonas sp. RF6]UFS70300.1 HD domain-containing protein [Geomonas sp. RF6]